MNSYWLEDAMGSSYGIWVDGWLTVKRTGEKFMADGILLLYSIRYIGQNDMVTYVVLYNASSYMKCLCRPELNYYASV